MTGNIPENLMKIPPPGAERQTLLRLFVIPLLVYTGWLIETYLLEGSIALFREPDVVLLILYTVVGCILIGIVVPVILLQKAFRFRTVNMLQIGFRSRRRTMTLCTITGAVCILILALASPPGMSHRALAELFLLYLPTAIASVMICWVLIGTHIQALVRQGGVIISISTSVVTTSILFGLTMLVHTPGTAVASPVVPAILLGMVTALFFFAIRDVYAAVIVLTTGLVLLSPVKTDPAVPVMAFVPVLLCSLAGFAALLAIHLYFSRKFTTVWVDPGA